MWQRLSVGCCSLSECLQAPYFFKDSEENLARFQGAVKLKKAGVKDGTIDAIVDGKIFIGMMREYLILSWGEPERINKSAGSWGVHEQFVYSSQYVYVENGIVTGYQD